MPVLDSVPDSTVVPDSIDSIQVLPYQMDGLCTETGCCREVLWDDIYLSGD